MRTHEDTYFNKYIKIIEGFNDNTDTNLNNLRLACQYLLIAAQAGDLKAIAALVSPFKAKPLLSAEIAKNVEEEYRNRLKQKYLLLFQSVQDNTHRNLSDLRLACQYLVISAHAGDADAIADLTSPLQEGLAQSKDVNKSIAKEYLNRLRQFNPESTTNYKDIKYAMYLALTSKRYSYTYQDYSFRYNEIHDALMQIIEASGDINFSHPHLKILKSLTEVSSQDIHDATNLLLAGEIAGDDPLHPPGQPFSYPFRIDSLDKIESIIRDLIASTNPELVNLLKRVAHNFKKNISRVPVVESANGKYVIRINVANLISSNKSIFTFYDIYKAKEVGRLFIVDDEIKFLFFGIDIKLFIQDNLDYSKLVFENPGSNSELIANFISVKNKPLHISAQAASFTYSGTSNNKNNVTFEVTDNLILSNKVKMLHTNNFFVKSKNLEFDAMVRAHEVAYFEIKKLFEMSPLSSCIAAKDILVKSGGFACHSAHLGAIQKIRIEATDKIYVHGNATLVGMDAIELNANSFMCKGKASIRTANRAELIFSDALTINQECIVTGSVGKLSARNIFNYCKHLTFENLIFTFEDSFTNYSTGIITTHQSFNINGKHVWNGGKINFGKSLLMRLNGIFVHGISSLDRTQIKQAVLNSALDGENINLVAGVVCNALGSIYACNVSLIAIAEIGPALSVTKSLRKARLISVDMSVDLPNLSMLYSDLSKVCKALRQSDGAYILDSLPTLTGTVLNGAAVARWILDTILPGLAQPVDAGWSLIMLIFSVPKLIKQVFSLIKRMQSGENIQACDYYEIMGTLGSLTIQSTNLWNQTSNLLHNGFDYDTSVVLNLSDIPSLSISFLSMYMPSNVDEAIFSGRIGGFHSNATMLNRAAYSYDFWSSRVGLNITNSFLSAIQNNSVTLANNISNTGWRLDRSGYEAAHGDFSNVNTETDSTVKYVQRVVYMVDNLTLNGKTKADTFIAKATDTITTTPSSTIEAENIDAAAKHLLLNGHIEGSKAEPAPINKPNDPLPATTSPDDKSENSTLEQKQTENPITPNVRLVAEEDAHLGTTSHVDGNGTSVLLNAKNIIDEGSQDVENILEQATSHLSVTPSAHHSASNVVSYKAPEATLSGAVDASKVFLDIDNFFEIREALSHTGNYVSFRPTSLLSIKTNQPIKIDKNFDFNYSVVLNGATITVDSFDIHTTKSFEFFSSTGDILTRSTRISADDQLLIDAAGSYTNEYGNLSGNIFSVHAQDNILNAGGLLQGNTYLQVISDHGNITNIGKERYNYFTYAGEIQFRSTFYDQGSMIGGSGVGYNNLGLYIKADGHFTNEGSYIYSPSDSFVNSRLGFDNQSHNILQYAYFDGSKWVSADVTNIAASSVISPNGKEIIIVDQGSIYNHDSIIFGNELSLQTPNGNIVNFAGILEATTYLEAMASGNILNECAVFDIEGRFSMMKRYNPACMLGGTGSSHNGIGLLMSAGGQFINDASVISSCGSNIISGDNGVVMEARHNTYISYHKQSSTWYGKTSETTVYSNQVEQPMVISLNGSNTIQSKDGGIYSVSTDYIAAHDNNFTALRDIQLYSLVLTDVTEKHSSMFWGLVHSSSRQTDELVVPLVIANPENTNIISLGGSVAIINALLVNSGKTTIQAQDDVLISLDKLKHSLNEESSGIFFQSPLASIGSSNPILVDYHALLASQSGLEMAANGWNLGLDAFNSANSFISGLRNNSFEQMFSPQSFLSFTLGFNHTRTSGRWESLPSGLGVYTGGLEVDADRSVTFGNGVPIYVSGDASIHAKIFRQVGADLHSDFSTESQSFSFGFAFDGCYNFGESASRTSNDSTNYVNQIFQVGGKLTVEADIWSLTDANLIAGVLDAHVGELDIVSHLNTSDTNSWSESFNTNGSFSFGFSSSHTGNIGVPSGITTTRGINLNACVINLEGGKIISYGPSHIVANVINAALVKEYSYGSSFGISGNMNDFNPDSPIAPGQPVIPSVNINFGNTNYQAMQYSTIWNNAANPVRANRINGELNQSNSDGFNVQRNEHVDLQLKVPLFNLSGLAQVEDNINWLRNVSGGNQARPLQGYYSNPAESNDDGDVPPTFDDTPMFNVNDLYDDDAEKANSQDNQNNANASGSNAYDDLPPLVDVTLDVTNLDISNMNLYAHGREDDEGKSARRQGFSRNSLFSRPNNPDGTENENDFDPFHEALGIAGVGAGLAQYNYMIGDKWRGINGKLYDINHGANQYTGSRARAIAGSEKFELIGRKIFYFDVLIETGSALEDYENSNYLGVAKDALDVGIARIGATGPLGFGIFAGYTALDFAYKQRVAIFRGMQSAPERAHEILRNGL